MVREERETRTWISLSRAAAYTLAPSALQHIAATGHPTSNPAVPHAHQPVFRPRHPSSVPLPPTIVRSTLSTIS
jgi:hypothetical protein